MRVCLLTADPGHPLLAAVSDLLAPDHQVETLDPGAEGPGPDLSSLADVYLLKARTPRALALAALLEEHGAPVLNSAAATARCQDRVAMAAVARAAGLPFAATRCVAALGELAAAGVPPGPLVIKSRFSRRHDLVARADSAVRLRELAADWAEEPVVVQDFVPNSGWDHKLWVVDGQLFAALRRSELAPDGRGPNLPLKPPSCPRAGPPPRSRSATSSAWTSTGWTFSAPVVPKPGSAMPVVRPVRPSSWTSTPSPGSAARPVPRRRWRPSPCGSRRAAGPSVRTKEK